GSVFSVGGFSRSVPSWVSSSLSSIVAVKNGSQSRRARKSSWSYRPGLMPAMRWHERRAFLLSAVNLGWNEHTVPMHEFRCVGVIHHVDDDRFALAHAQNRPRGGAVVADGRDDVRAVEFDRN